MLFSLFYLTHSLPGLRLLSSLSLGFSLQDQRWPSLAIICWTQLADQHWHSYRHVASVQPRVSKSPDAVLNITKTERDDDLLNLLCKDKISAYSEFDGSSTFQTSWDGSDRGMWDAADWKTLNRWTAWRDSSWFLKWGHIKYISIVDLFPTVITDQCSLCLEK